jgi:hypothetical protein
MFAHAIMFVTLTPDVADSTEVVSFMLCKIKDMMLISLVMVRVI